MEFKSTQKYVIQSPSKIREVVGLIKKLKPQQALDRLPFINKKASVVLSKVIKTAVANATQKNVSISELSFKDIQINEGPRLKRGRPISRGQWHPILKRMSHIRVILEAKDTVEKKVQPTKREQEKKAPKPTKTKNTGKESKK